MITIWCSEEIRGRSMHSCTHAPPLISIIMYRPALIHVHVGVPLMHCNGYIEVKRGGKNMNKKHALSLVPGLYIYTCTCTQPAMHVCALTMHGVYMHADVKLYHAAPRLTWIFRSRDVPSFHYLQRKWAALILHDPFLGIHFLVLKTYVSSQVAKLFVNSRRCELTTL